MQEGGYSATKKHLSNCESDCSIRVFYILLTVLLEYIDPYNVLFLQIFTSKMHIMTRNLSDLASFLWPKMYIWNLSFSNI